MYADLSAEGWVLIIGALGVVLAQMGTWAIQVLHLYLAYCRDRDALIHAARHEKNLEAVAADVRKVETVANVVKDHLLPGSSSERQ